jgi:FKBP-type peptidyl-prolyl cis-trans isomerase
MTRIRPSTLVLALSSLLWGAFALNCTGLTAPPSPEPIASAEPSASAAPSAAPAPAPAPAPTPSAAPPAAPTNEKLGSVDVTVGKGQAAKSGDKVSVNYVGKLPDGKEFDASAKHGKPFEFQLGQGGVIKGWDQGVVGMKVGGKRRLTIPPSLAYGDRGVPGVIPPGSTLTFDIELLGVNAPAQAGGLPGQPGARPAQAGGP